MFQSYKRKTRILKIKIKKKRFKLEKINLYLLKVLNLDFFM